MQILLVNNLYSSVLFGTSQLEYKNLLKTRTDSDPTLKSKWTKFNAARLRREKDAFLSSCWWYGGDLEPVVEVSGYQGG